MFRAQIVEDLFIVPEMGFQAKAVETFYIQDGQLGECWPFTHQPHSALLSSAIPTETRSAIKLVEIKVQHFQRLTCRGKTEFIVRGTPRAVKKVKI